jgi:flagellum-specific peptidoglycan hydrolase FlgJ
MSQMYLRQSPEKEMRNTILISLLLMLLPVSVSAQFYTITRDSEILPTERRKESYNRAAKDVTEGKKNKMMVKDTLIVGPDNQKKLENISRNSDRNASLKTELQKKTDDITKSENHLPELTIPNLYKEIIRNGILYPKIVLAQAILETGWFRSSVCRNKHNLFGLTNPRTGKYYEFNHWTESVRAYYTKVQYKYKGGNYLLWLDEIGYAEDPNYLVEIISILKMLL